MAKGGDRKAAVVVHQLDDLNEYLSACQFGITLASLGIGFLGEPAIAELIEPVLEDFAHAVAAPIAIAVAYILVTIAPHHRRRAGAEDLRDRQRRGRGQARGAAR